MALMACNITCNKYFLQRDDEWFIELVDLKMILNSGNDNTTLEKMFRFSSHECKNEIITILILGLVKDAVKNRGSFYHSVLWFCFKMH